MYKLFLTIRYLTRRPLSLVAMLVLAVAMAVLVVAPSVMSGFQEEFHKRLRGAYSDVSLLSSRPFTFPEDPAIEDYLRSVPGVAAVAPYVETPALDKHLKRIDYCFLRGIDVEQEPNVSKLDQWFLSEKQRFLRIEKPDMIRGDPERVKEIYETAELLSDTVDLKALYKEIEEGSPLEPGMPAVAVGIHFLVAWDLRVGETFSLTTATSDGEVKQDQTVVIVGAFSSGRHEFDRRLVLMSIPSLQGLVGVPNKVSGYSIRMTDFNNADQAADALKADIRNPRKMTPLRQHDLKGFFVTTWKERNENLLKAVKMEELLIRLITWLIVASSAASIFLVLFMTVHAKVRELGILRAIGATRSGVLSLFLFQGMLIAAVGLVLGTVMGQVFGAHINEIADFIYSMTGWHPFPPDVYYLEEIPFKFEPQDLFVNFFATLALGGALAFVPGLIAALKPPLRAIRYE